MALSSFSQIKVYDDNRVKILGDRPTDDPDNNLSIQIYGNFGTCLANGKLAFGDYELNSNILYANKVFAAEFGVDYDSDKLELCGSNGLYLTSEQGYEYGDVIGKLDIQYEYVNSVLTDVSRFQFETDVYAKGIILNSDERFKTDIEPLIDPLANLQKVRGVSYNLKPVETTTNLTDNSDFGNDKEKADMALLEATKERKKIIERERLGFIAEEIEEIYPGLVDKDSDGYLHVDYIGLIPVLVESIKQQQTQIATLQTLLKSEKF